MYRSESLNIIRFDSMAELGMYTRSNNIGKDGSDDWNGGIDLAESYDRCINGDESQVGAAEKLMEKFSGLDLASQEWIDSPSVAGCYPCVPEALMGEPECMREPEAIDSERGGLTILVDVSCSATISAEQMRARGVVVLALVMMLARSRPVTLELTSIHEGKRREGTDDQFSIASVRINTTPLDLASAGFGLTHAAFARRLMYRLNQHIDGFQQGGNFGIFKGVQTGALYDEGFPANCKAYRDRIAGYLGIDGDVLIVPPAIKIGKTKILRDPEGWLRDQLAEYAPQSQQ